MMGSTTSNTRWGILVLTAVVILGACSDSDDPGGEGGGSGGDGATAGLPPALGGGGGAGGEPGGWGGGCFRILTSGGGPDCIKDDTPCSEHADAARCEAAGCVPTIGTLSTLLDAHGGAAAGGAPAGAGGAADGCTTTEDVFISCEEGYGGAIHNTACNDTCSSCLAGPWTVGRFPPYERDDCGWTCVDGQIRSGDGEEP